MPKAHLPERKAIAKFFPVAKPLAVLKGRHGEARVTRWNKTAAKTFERNRIKPLSEKENQELKIIVGVEGENTRFYRDHRNLFAMVQEPKKFVGYTVLKLFRVRKDGSFEDNYYARVLFTPFGKRANIKAVALNPHFLENANIQFARPKPGFSQRGVMPAFVDFFSRNGFEEVRATVIKKARPAYEKAGFDEVKPGSSGMLWRKKNKGS